MSSAARLSPTANLLRKSRLFALPHALTPPQDPPTSRTVNESDTATLPHPIRASIESPRSCLARGDWGLKRPLPAKTTSGKSSNPIIRVKEHDTFEYVTDFESAADHTTTLEKFQDLHLPISLPMTDRLARINLQHISPFESDFDNTETSDDLRQPGTKQFRHTGPWIAGQTEPEFRAYLEKVRRSKPQLLQRLRERFVAIRRKQAQDNGDDLGDIKLSEEDFQTYLKSLRADPGALGPVIFELLDLPSPPPVPHSRIGTNYYMPPGTNLASTEYAYNGPPKTHPSAGLSYTRSHASLYNHPEYGPQAHQRPLEARILEPKGKYKGNRSRGAAGVAGFVSVDYNSSIFVEQGAPAGLAFFDASIPGGGKYWVNPTRACVGSDGKVHLTSLRANATAKAPYGMDEYKAPRIPDTARGNDRVVPKLDKVRPGAARYMPPSDEPVETGPSLHESEDSVKSLMKSIGV